MRRSAASARRRRIRCDCVVKYFPHELTLSTGRAMNAITAPKRCQLDAPPVEFKLNGREVVGASRRNHHRDRQARRHRDPAALLQGRPRGRSATAAPAWSRSTASACWRRRAAARPSAGMEVSTNSERAAASRRRWCSNCCWPTCPRPRTRATTKSTTGPRKLGVGKPRFARARAAGAGPVAPGHRRQPGRLHPVHALPARLPRRAGQRRHRPGLPRRAREDRVRHGRPDGRVHLRGLRRMRAGLPDRRADAGARRRADGARQAGRFGVPVSAASAASSPTTSRTTRSCTSKAATARPTTAGCASRAATASTTRTTRSA